MTLLFLFVLQEKITTIAPATEEITTVEDITTDHDETVTWFADTTYEVTSEDFSTMIPEIEGVNNIEK